MSVNSLREFALHFLSLEHGGDRDPVPAKWRHAPQLQPWTWYGLSSLFYSIAGLMLVSLLVLYPERAQAGDHAVSTLLVWQGLISFKCDALDLCVRSWSHPAYRISACAFILGMLAKPMTVFCCGRAGMALLCVIFCIVLGGFYAFHRSCRACHDLDLPVYARWHTRWHLAFPCALAMVWFVQYGLVLDRGHCQVEGAHESLRGICEHGWSSLMWRTRS
jgi:hypothetical protein